jgi:hypothetical protein
MYTDKMKLRIRQLYAAQGMELQRTSLSMSPKFKNSREK